MTATQQLEPGVDIVLRDGSTLHVRPVEPGDEERICTFLERLSGEARTFRFFSGGANLRSAARYAASAAEPDSNGVVATAGADGHVLAHAMWVRVGADRAEIAFATAGELQDKGVATTLLAHLAESAAAAGIRAFVAEVMASNHRMAKVFKDSGFAPHVRSEAGRIVFEMPTELSDEARRRFEQRDGTAAAAAVAAVLRPSSVALIGASRRPGTIGHAVMTNLRTAGFTGDIHLVNQNGGRLDGAPLRKSILEIEQHVDLAVIAVPAAAVPAVARQCAEHGVRALVVLSAGFSEAGAAGRRLQRELLEICRAGGMRLVGPNCLGVLNAGPEIGLNATFAPTAPPPGRVGVMTQSGGVGIALIERFRAIGLGVSSLASVGDKADLSGNDFLQYWEQDDETAAVVLYLESFGNPRKFARVARRVGEHKPVLAVKSGRTAAGARAAQSHTGALLAASDVTVDALFRQAGVIRAETLGELLDVATLVAGQPLPTGRSVAVLTNAGGPGIMCADALEAAGLEVPTLPAGTARRLASFLPAQASVSNPVDMIASATADDYRRALEILIEEPAIDAIVTVFVPPLVTEADAVAQAIAQALARRRRDVPVLAVFMTAAGAPAVMHTANPAPATYSFPEDAARALARVTDYADWRREPRGAVPVFEDVRAAEAAAILAGALAHGGGWLAQEHVAALLGCYGITLAPWRLAATPEEAARAARRLGGELALKAIAPGLVHKTDAGGVRVGLRGPTAVRRAAEEMRVAVARARHPECGFLVQRVITGAELLMGVVHDAQFGPVVACGAGGTAAELAKDLVVRIAPLTDRDARSMIRSLAMFPLLDGYRGRPAADVVAVEDVLLRLGALVDAHPEIAEVDLNPVIASPAGAVVVDARVRVAAPGPQPPIPSVGR